MKLFKELLIYLKERFVEYIKSRIFPVTILFFVLTFVLVHRENPDDPVHPGKYL